MDIIGSVLRGGQMRRGGGGGKGAVGAAQQCDTRALCDALALLTEPPPPPPPAPPMQVRPLQAPQVQRGPAARHPVAVSACVGGAAGRRLCFEGGVSERVGRKVRPCPS